jgi:Holliday junction resolvase RusA-like endonuclease
MIEIVLAGAPVGKQRVRVAQDGHVYTPEKTVTFEGRLAYAAQQVMGAKPLLDGQLVVDIVVLMPIPVSKPEKWKVAARSGEVRPTSKPDFDNFAKMIDALNLIVWVDDAKIVRGAVDKFYSDRPCFALRVRPTDERDRNIPLWVEATLAGKNGVFE